MSDAEKALLKKFAHDIADKYMPEIVDLELEHVPAPYSGFAKMLWEALEPKFQAYLDAKIEAM